MRRKSFHLAPRLAGSLQIPRDLSSREPILTFTGKGELCVENYRKILEYNQHFICIETKTYRFSVEGRDLKIQYYTSEEMKIIGCFEKIFFHC